MSKNQRDNSRTVALRVLLDVWRKKVALNDALSREAVVLDSRDRALCQQLVFGVCRWHGSLQQHLKPMLKKPLREKDLDIQLILMLGLYQLCGTRIEPHAAVNETVTLVGKTGKSWARGMVNAILRRCQREPLQLDSANLPQCQANWPAWLLKQLQQDWPQQWREIVSQTQQQADLMLRVNRRRCTPDELQQQWLEAGISTTRVEFLEQALVSPQSLPVEQLPGYDAGYFSVQDGAAQLAAELLRIEHNQVVLDACAAPGGKSSHLLESADIDLYCLEIAESKIPRLKQNLERLGLQAHIRCADASQSLDQLPRFDRILLDAPCSATGIIRRHPDILLLRKAEDWQQLQQTQQALLEQNWRRLKPGGILLYATCSILKAENEQQIALFLQRHDDAEELPLEPAEWGQAASVGRQILPGQQGLDGFYYARLIKH